MALALAVSPRFFALSTLLSLAAFVSLVVLFGWLGGRGRGIGRVVTTPTIHGHERGLVILDGHFQGLEVTFAQRLAEFVGGLVGTAIELSPRKRA